MSNNYPRRAVVTPGSKATFWVDLVDESMGRPIDLSAYTSGKAVFCNCDGEKVEVVIDLTTDDAKCGSVLINIPSSDTVSFDEQSKDFDFEFSDASDTTIIPVYDMIEIVPRNCP